jgi:hypothetical protein
MANELRGATGAGQVCYALVMNSSGQFWNTADLAFETFSSGNYADYVIDLDEVGTNTGIYLGNFPSAITTAGTYEYFVKPSVNGANLESEDDPISNTGRIDWTGVTIASASADSLSGTQWLAYFLRGGFKRTDKDTEVYEETTDAIQEMRRLFAFDEAEVEMTTTDTISVLGDYKIDIETNTGLILGINVIDGENATPLIFKSKREFNLLYPDISVTSDKGYPQHFTMYKGQFQIGPIPDSVSYLYRVDYSARAGIISSATTSVPFTNLYRDILRDNVNYRMYKLMEDFAKAAEFRSSFENGFLQAKRRERANSGQGTFNVRPCGM